MPRLCVYMRGYGEPEVVKHFIKNNCFYILCTFWPPSEAKYQSLSICVSHALVFFYIYIYFFNGNIHIFSWKTIAVKEEKYWSSHTDNKNNLLLFKTLSNYQNRRNVYTWSPVFLCDTSLSPLAWIISCWEVFHLPFPPKNFTEIEPHALLDHGRISRWFWSRNCPRWVYKQLSSFNMIVSEKIPRHFNNICLNWITPVNQHHTGGSTLYYRSCDLSLPVHRCFVYHI